MIYLNKNQRLLIEGTGSRSPDENIRVQGIYFRGPGSVSVNFTPSLIPFNVIKYQLTNVDVWHTGYKFTSSKGSW